MLEKIIRHAPNLLEHHIARQITVEMTALPDVALTLQYLRKKEKNMLYAEDNLTDTDLVVSGLREFPKHVRPTSYNMVRVCLDCNDEPT